MAHDYEYRRTHPTILCHYLTSAPKQKTKSREKKHTEIPRLNACIVFKKSPPVEPYSSNLHA